MRRRRRVPCLGLLIVLTLSAAARGEPGKHSAPLALTGLSPQKTAQVRELARRYHAQQRKLITLPDAAKLIDLRVELQKLCRIDELVTVTFAADSSLSQAAFNLLQRESFNTQLTKPQAQRLLQHILVRDPKASWKALWAAGVLGPNRAQGVPLLIAQLKRATDPFVRVHVAGALGKQKKHLDAATWRRAVTVLLTSLGNADDTAREAHNYLPRFEPWMSRWLIDRLLKAGDASPYWHHGLARLSSGQDKALRKPLRKLFLRALKHPKVAVRISAVVGLRDQGLTRRDLQVCRQIARDKDPNVRRILYAGLSQVKKPWTAPLLLAGLRDSSFDAIAESAYSLMALGHRPAVPRLVALLRRLLKDPKLAKAILPNAFRIAGAAAVKLAGLPGYDFAPKYDSVGNRHMRATVIVNRDDHYRREAKRLLRWWATRGRRKRWR